MSEHLLEMAKARVRVKDDKIEVLTDPLISCCPLRRELYGIEKDSHETVERVLQSHVQDLGMYGPQRILELQEKPVSFGASEILMDAMTEGLVDSAVVVCEGAGTVVVARPDVLQAVGAHMTCLIQTEPIAEVQERLAKRDCLLLDRLATVNQVWGFEKAVAAGFRRIAVTVADANTDEATALREMEAKLWVRLFLLAVHTIGISKAQATALAESCDLVWSCASKAVRDVVGKKARLQMGVSIPVFALTGQDRRLLLSRALHFAGPLALHRAGQPLAPEGKHPEPLI